MTHCERASYDSSVDLSMDWLGLLLSFGIKPGIECWHNPLFWSLFGRNSVCKNFCLRSRSKPVWDAFSCRTSGTTCQRLCDQITPSWCQQAISVHSVVNVYCFAFWLVQLVMMAGPFHLQDLQWALGLPELVCSGKPRIYIRLLASNHWIDGVCILCQTVSWFFSSNQW